MSRLVLFTVSMAFACTSVDSQNQELPQNLSAIADEAGANVMIGENWSPGIETWEAPEEVRSELRYYHMGYDYNNRPVVVWETGKWDVKKYVENPNTKEMYYKYIEQFWFRILNLTSPDTDDGIVMIFDADQFAASQLLSLEVIKVHLYAIRFGEKYESRFSDVLFINMNFVGETWINIIRPIGGRFLGRSQSYGTRKEIWGPVLANKIPKSQLAPWFTGSEDFKPVTVWG